MREVDLDPFEHRTISHVLRDQAAHIGDDVWMMFGTEHRTYADVNALVNRYAHGFARDGVGAGDLVAIVMDDCEEYVYVCLALAKLGAIHLTVNTAYKGPYLEHVLGHSEATRVVVDPGYVDRLAAVLPSLPHLRQVLVRGQADLTMPKAQVVPLAMMLSDNIGEPVSPAEPGTVMSVLYTSGTTGRSKGAMMSHSYWCYASRAIYKARDVRPGDVFFCPTPMFHAGVWLYNIYSALLSGLRVGIDDHFSVSNFWERVRLYGATQVQTIGAMHMFIWAQPERADDADNPVRVWVPVPLPIELWEPFKERFGVEHLVFQYGQTEVVPVTIGAVGTTTKPGSCGTALPHLEMKILDEWRSRRDLCPASGPSHDVRGLLQERRGDDGGVAKPLAPHGRLGAGRRGWRALLHRPGAGLPSAPGREHLLVRSRIRSRPTSCDRGCRSACGSIGAHRRRAQGVCDPQERRDHDAQRTLRALHRGTAVLRGPSLPGVPG
jgi:crotonobetaine/carnitine-CoA ligase